MKRKDLKKEIAEKLKHIRESLEYSNDIMAKKMGIARCSYNRNEKSETIPDIIALYRLGNNLNISLDWLIRNIGPMHYPDKIPEKKEIPKPQTPPGMPRELEDDLKEIFEQMKHSPQLRYEILAHFHKFKDEHNEIMKKTI